MPPREYQAYLSRQELRLRGHHLRREWARQQRVHPNLDTSPTKTRHKNRRQLIQSGLGHAV